MHGKSLYFTGYAPTADSRALNAGRRLMPFANILSAGSFNTLLERRENSNTRGHCLKLNKRALTLIDYNNNTYFLQKKSLMFGISWTRSPSLLNDLTGSRQLHLIVCFVSVYFIVLYQSSLWLLHFNKLLLLL